METFTHLEPGQVVVCRFTENMAPKYADLTWRLYRVDSRLRGESYWGHWLKDGVEEPLPVRFIERVATPDDLLHHAADDLRGG